MLCSPPAAQMVRPPPVVCGARHASFLLIFYGLSVCLRWGVNMIVPVLIPYEYHTRAAE